MAPNLRFTKQAEENEELDQIKLDQLKDETELKKYDYKLQIVWRNVSLMGALHLSAIYGMYLMIASAKWQTNLFGKFIIISTILISLI